MEDIILVKMGMGGWRKVEEDKCGRVEDIILEKRERGKEGKRGRGEGILSKNRVKICEILGGGFPALSRVAEQPPVPHSGTSFRLAEQHPVPHSGTVFRSVEQPPVPHSGTVFRSVEQKKFSFLCIFFLTRGLCCAMMAENLT